MRSGQDGALTKTHTAAPASSRWRDPNSAPLDGSPWDAVRESVLTDLGLPEDLSSCWAAHSEQLDETYQAVVGPVDANTAVSIDTDGRVLWQPSRRSRNPNR